MLRLAMETRKVMLVDIALDLVQKLVAHHHLAGPVHAIGHRRDPTAIGRGGTSLRTEDEDGGDPASADGPLPPQVPPLPGSLPSCDHCWCRRLAAYTVSRGCLAGGVRNLK